MLDVASFPVDRQQDSGQDNVTCYMFILQIEEIQVMTDDISEVCSQYHIAFKVRTEKICACAWFRP